MHVGVNELFSLFLLHLFLVVGGVILLMLNLVVNVIRIINENVLWILVTTICL